MAAVGHEHSLCLSDEGSLFSFGRNSEGQLGHSNNQKCSLPKQIEGLPRIMLVSCGYYFSACVDERGTLWTFGQNNNGQLGLGNQNNQNQPQRVESLPPLLSVHCGGFHCICIAQDSSIWSFGRNSEGQLALGHNRTPQSSPQQLPPLPQPIQHISCGYYHTLFLSQSGCVYGSGSNIYGQLGLGNTRSQNCPETIIPNMPQITSISCGFYHSVFLCSQSCVYACGYNGHGELGLGHTTNQLSSKKVPGLQNIDSISCGGSQTRCIDREGNLYCWGYNGHGQLGLGDITSRTKVTQSTMKSAQLLSEGSSGYHCLVKHTDGSISAFGMNSNGQLGLIDTSNKTSPQKLDEKHNGIYSGKKTKGGSKWSSVANEANWSDVDVANLQLIEGLLSNISLENLERNKKTITQLQAPGLGWTKWAEVQTFLLDMQRKIEHFWKEGDEISARHENELNNVRKEKEDLEKKLAEINKRLPLLVEQREEHRMAMKHVDESFHTLKQLNETVQLLCENEGELEEAFCHLLQNKSLNQVNEDELELLLWKMNLAEYCSLFAENHVTGEIICDIEYECEWIEMGMTHKDACMLLYYRSLMKRRGYVQSLQSSENVDCVVCFHNTVERTLELITEFEIPLDQQIIEDKKWTAPSLIYATSIKELVKSTDLRTMSKIRKQLSEWKHFHNKHLKSLPK